MESCGILLLFRRGERLYLLGMAPIVAQEVVQFFLWRAVQRDEDAGLAPPAQCSADNTLLSLLEVCELGEIALRAR